jgi:hypothetical protein
MREMADLEDGWPGSGCSSSIRRDAQRWVWSEMGMKARKGGTEGEDDAGSALAVFTLSDLHRKSTITIASIRLTGLASIPSTSPLSLLTLTRSNAYLYCAGGFLLSS